MNIRKARADDVEDIAALWNEGWYDGHFEICPAELTAERTIETFTARTASRVDTTYVVESNQIDGFFMLEGAEVYQFYVGRSGRGTGLATKLIQAAEEQIASAGHETARLACSVGNDRAARFYEKSGWVRQGVIVENVEISKGTFPIEVWDYHKRLIRD